MNATNTTTRQEAKEAYDKYLKLLKNLGSADSFLENAEYYIENVLPLEMPFVRGASMVPAQPCQTLVLLVGHVPDPLLQTICFYQPQARIILVLNRFYNLEPGKVMGEHMEDLIEALKEGGLLENAPQVMHYVVEPEAEGTIGPADIFQTLLGALHDTPSESIILDITGAKKSMVVGAFLYATFANVPISYVEFGDKNYDLTVGRPAGYLSQIKRLTNPYETFALREWARVRTLYERYQFREARDELVGPDGQGGAGTLLAVTRRYQPDAAPTIRRMAEALACYMYWDNGNFNSAQAQAAQLDGFSPPSVVQKLGGKWFTVSDTGFDHIPSAFYDDTEAFRAYAYDELERVDRLVRYQQDYRSAFLRAAGLNEVLLVARLVRLAETRHKSALLDALDKKTPSASKLFKALLESQDSPFSASSIVKGVDARVALKTHQGMDRWWSQTPFEARNGWEKFLAIRNKLAHTFVSVPETLARAGLQFVRANWDDFVGDGPAPKLEAAAWEWRALCKWSGVDQILPPNLLSTSGG
jgi:hypothetical protein